jgi:hypothetical protein
VAGRKQFRIYAPTDQIPVYGSMQQQIQPNGLISYSRADGYPEGSEQEEEETDDEEEEVVFGKGFDYKSESEDDEEDDSPLNGVDDYEALVGGEEGEANDQEEAKEEHGRPDHFSEIDPTNADVKEKHPSFANCRESLVELEAGQCLYLPASWFHFVTSYGPFHLAINYWYHPPDQLDRFDNPYQQNDWKKMRKDEK